MDWFRRPQPDYTSIQLVSNDATDASSTRGTLQRIRDPTIGPWRRFLPTLAVLFTSACAFTIWSLRLTYWKDSLGFYNLVVTHRVSVQVFIHVLATFLTVLWIYGVSTTINLLMRLRFANGGVSINTLRMWTLISQARLNINLPFRHFILCACFYAIAVLPAWLWTGALTPQLIDYPLLANATLPKAGAGAYPFLTYRLPNDDFNFECFNTTQANGTFTSCPGLYQSGNLLQSAGSATTIDGSPRNHSKYDNTEYRYTGRSYGAGSSVGLTVRSPPTATLQGYSYTEQGYLTTADCVYNSSSLWVLRFIDSYDSGDIPNVYYAEGCFPNSLSFPNNGTCGLFDHYSLVSLGLDGENMVAMGSTNSDNLTDYYLAIAASAPYAELNQIQCQVSFSPTKFAVNVSTINATISVVPLDKFDDPEPRGLLRSRVMDSLNVISMVQTTLYVSTVGEALESNVRNYVSWATGSSKLGSATHSQILAAVKASVQAMADDILESFAAAALTQPESVQLDPVHFTAKGVEIGEYPYIIAILAYQTLALIGVVAALLLTKFWSSTPAFDFTDLGALSTAISLGAKPNDGAVSKATRGWQGEPDHAALGMLTVRYRHAVPSEPPVVQISAQRDPRGSNGGTVYWIQPP